MPRRPVLTRSACEAVQHPPHDGAPGADGRLCAHEAAWRDLHGLLEQGRGAAAPAAGDRGHGPGDGQPAVAGARAAGGVCGGEERADAVVEEGGRRKEEGGRRKEEGGKSFSFLLPPSSFLTSANPASP